MTQPRPQQASRSDSQPRIEPATAQAFLRSGSPAGRLAAFGVGVWVLLAGLIPLGLLLWLVVQKDAGAQNGFLGFHAQWTLDNFMSVARTYLSRNAFMNTAITTLVAMATASCLMGLFYPALKAGGRVAVFTRCLAGGVLLLPPATGMLIWRELWANTLWLTDARLAVWANGLVLGWRLAPVGLLCLWAAMGRFNHRDAHLRLGPVLLALFMLGWLATIDVPVVYLLTFGEPFNAAHTAATWAFQQAWVARFWREAAVILTALCGFTLLMWVAAGFVTRSALWDKRLPAVLLPSLRSINAPISVVAAIVLLPMPIWWRALWVDWARLPQTVVKLVEAGAPGWLANGAAVALGAALLAWWVARTLWWTSRDPAHGARGQSLLLRALPLVGMLGMAALYLPVGRLAQGIGLGDTRLLLLVCYGVWAGLLSGLWWGLPAGRLPRARTGIDSIIPVAIALFMVQQDFAAGLFFGAGYGDAMPGVGSVLYLANAPQMSDAVWLLAVGMLLFFAMLWGAATIVWAIAHRRTASIGAVTG